MSHIVVVDSHVQGIYLRCHWGNM